MKRIVAIKLWVMCFHFPEYHTETFQCETIQYVCCSWTLKIVRLPRVPLTWCFALPRRVTETHALAAANQQKNDRLRAAFGISSDYVDGSSFHADRKEKEKEKREQERLEREKLQQQKYM